MKYVLILVGFMSGAAIMFAVQTKASIHIEGKADPTPEPTPQVIETEPAVEPTAQPQVDPQPEEAEPTPEPTPASCSV